MRRCGLFRQPPSPRAKKLPDRGYRGDNESNQSDGTENHCGMEGCKNPCDLRRKLGVILRSLMRCDETILYKDKNSVGDRIRSHHCSNRMSEALHPPNEKELSDR
jgi:hypothetical protein